MRFTGIAAMGDFWRVVREFNPEGIEREATAPLGLWIVGEPGSGKRTLAASLRGIEEKAAPKSPLKTLDVGFAQAPSADLQEADLLLLVVRLDQDLTLLARRVSAFIGRTYSPVILVLTHSDAVENSRDLRNASYRAFSFVSHLRTVFVDARDQSEVQSQLLPMLLESIPSLRTSLARHLPAARPYVSNQIIAETCRVNAQFALAANLPANIPFLGGIAGSVADFFVLTKNQVMMIFRLAAIHGRDISPTIQVAAEIAPVVGGALLWRSAARFLVGLLPSLLAAAPKMAIAYVGTYAAGQAARYYYDEGRPAPGELLKSFSDEGARLYRRMLSGNEVSSDPA